jgi:transposase
MRDLYLQNWRSIFDPRTEAVQAIQPAWLGLTPRANSSGGKDRQVGISTEGDGYIRRLLVSGASAIMRFARQGDSGKAWLVGLKERKRAKVAAVARANKTARIAWAILRRSEVFAARAA